MLWFRRHVLRRRMSTDGRSERGATAVEYGIIVALFAIGMFGVVSALRVSLNSNYAASEGKVGAPQSQLAAPSLPSYDPNKCPAGQWPNPLTGACDTSQKDTCKAASQGWDSGSNSCVACTASQWFNSSTVACDASLQSTCNGSGQAWNSSNNTCVPCTASQPLDPASGTCKATSTNCVLPLVFDGSACSPTAPAAPGAPTVTAGVKSLSVSWSAPASTGGSPITGYLVECKTSAATTWTSYGTVAGTSTTVTGLADGTSYTCRVTAQNAVGSGAPSSASAASTTPTVPGTPTSVSAVRGDKQVTLTWLAPADTGGSTITGYLVECKADSASTWTSYGTVTTLYTTVTGLANGAPYSCRVTAQNAVGSSAPASSSSFTPKAPFSGGPSATYGPINAGNNFTYDLNTDAGISTAVTFSTATCSGNGCSRSSFTPATGAFTFNSNFGTRTATYTVPWSVAETSTMEGGSGTLTIGFT